MTNSDELLKNIKKQELKRKAKQQQYRANRRARLAVPIETTVLRCRQTDSLTIDDDESQF